MMTDRDDLPAREFGDNAVLVQSEVIAENGRWAVYLVVTFWNAQRHEVPMHTNHDPIETVRRRIADYPTQLRAAVAAKWIMRGADRGLSHPTLGF
jgi:hypothetical protein